VKGTALPQNIGGFIACRKEEADRLLVRFPITLDITRFPMDAWSHRRLTEDMSDDQMEAFAATLKLSLEAVALPELVQTASEQIVHYVSVTDRTRKKALPCKESMPSCSVKAPRISEPWILSRAAWTS
jgi:hypothetical protein